MASLMSIYRAARRNVVARRSNNLKDIHEQLGIMTEEEKEYLPDEWMIRKCDMYKEEHSDCINLKSRFNQYFIFGELLDCSQWKTDLQNCRKFESNKDKTAYKELVESESKRRLQRLKAHYNNDVWKKRDKPPEDWNKPLPEWMHKEQENTYLDQKNKQMKAGIQNDMDVGITFCTIA